MYPTVQEQLQCLLLQPLQHVKLTYTYKTYNTEIQTYRHTIQKYTMHLTVYKQPHGDSLLLQSLQHR